MDLFILLDCGRRTMIPSLLASVICDHTRIRRRGLVSGDPAPTIDEIDNRGTSARTDDNLPRRGENQGYSFLTALTEPLDPPGEREIN